MTRPTRQLAAAVLALGLIAVNSAVASAGPPTTVSASPIDQTSSGCKPVGSWTVYLGGGLTGAWTVTTTWGDGSPATTINSTITSFAQNHTFANCVSWSFTVNQSRRASRAGGGTSGYHYTHVLLTP